MRVLNLATFGPMLILSQPMVLALNEELLDGPPLSISEDCEDFATNAVGNTLAFVDKLSDPALLTSMCSPGKREELLLEIEVVSSSADPCVQQMYQEIEREHHEALAAIHDEEGCYNEVSEELKNAHEIQDLISRRRLSNAGDGNHHRELGFWLAPLIPVVAGKLITIGIHAGFNSPKAGGKRRVLRARDDGLGEAFDFVKDEPFVAPPSINTKCNSIPYDVKLVMTPGPHFVLGAKPKQATNDCPSLAFDSHNFQGTKTMFVMNSGEDLGIVAEDPMFALGSSTLNDIFTAFDETSPLVQSEFHVEASNCFHFVQKVWRQLDLPESSSLLDFIVDNAVKDKNIGVMLSGAGATEESRIHAGAGVDVLKGYIYEIASRQLNITEA